MTPATRPYMSDLFKHITEDIRDNALEIFFSLSAFMHHMLFASAHDTLPVLVAIPKIWTSVISAVLAGGGTHILKLLIDHCHKKIKQRYDRSK